MDNHLAKLKILLIRNKDDSIYTSVKLHELGFAVVCASLQKTIYYDTLLQQEDTQPYLIMTSKNAVYATYKQLNRLSSKQQLRFYVVGRRTAENIELHIKNHKIEYISPNVTALVEYMRIHCCKSESYYYLRGESQKINLVKAMLDIGFESVFDSIVYSDIPIEDNYILAREFFAQTKLDCGSSLYVLLYSSGSAKRLIDILVEKNMHNRKCYQVASCNGVIAICISADVAAYCLKAAGLFVQVIVASEPNENAMIEMLVEKTRNIKIQ